MYLAIPPIMLTQQRAYRKLINIAAITLGTEIILNYPCIGYYNKSKYNTCSNSH